MSSFGGIDINVEKNNIDVLVSSANKCLEGIPGFAFSLIKKSLLNRDLKTCGDILHENWKIKIELAKGITNSKINEMYEDSINAGALGGKILGAGGRGYLMLICPVNKKKKILNKFKKYEFMNFEFDYLGSRRLIHI